MSGGVNLGGPLWTIGSVDLGVGKGGQTRGTAKHEVNLECKLTQDVTWHEQTLDKVW